jgi:xanthine dehydrogenase YagT iron-sulfur-binding subunit
MSPSPEDTDTLKLRVNGSELMLRIEPRVTLLDALRGHAHLNGTKKAATRASAARAR